MFIRHLKSTSILKIAVAASLVLTLSSLSFNKAEAAGQPWYGMATGTCDAPVSVEQFTGGQTVLVVGSGLMPGSSFVYTVSAYGPTSRGMMWSLRQIGQVGQSGIFCAVVFVADANDQGTFLMQINGVDSTMHQYNPASQVFQVTPAPVPLSDNAQTVMVGGVTPPTTITPVVK